MTALRLNGRPRKQLTLDVEEDGVAVGVALGVAADAQVDAGAEALDVLQHQAVVADDGAVLGAVPQLPVLWRGRQTGDDSATRLHRQQRGLSYLPASLTCYSIAEELNDRSIYSVNE